MLLSRGKRNGNCDSDEEQKKDMAIEIPMILDDVAEDLLVRTRRLLLVGEINEVVSTHICSYLQVLSLKKDPVFMYIDSPGGCISAGYAIIDQMMSCRCPIYTIVRGKAHSMGAIIAAYGTKGHRYSMPNSSFMLHSMLVACPQDSIEKQSTMMKHLEADYIKKIADLSKRMKITKPKLIQLMIDTKWMSPQGAMKIGLVDGIWTPSKERKVSRSCQE